MLASVAGASATALTSVPMQVSLSGAEVILSHLDRVMIFNSGQDDIVIPHKFSHVDAQFEIQLATRLQ